MGHWKNMSPADRGPLIVFVAFSALAGCTTSTSQQTTPKAIEDAAVRRTLADVEKRINASDLSFIDVFTNDAVIVAPGAADVVGGDSIRALYTDLLKQASITVHFSTDEVVVADNLAVERGTYTMVIADRTSGKIIQDVKNKHMHIMRKQRDGSWKTWRMMVNNAEPSVASKTSR